MAPPPQQQPYPGPAPYQGYPAPTYPVGPVPVTNNNQTTVVVQQQATQVTQGTTVIRR